MSTQPTGREGTHGPGRKPPQSRESVMRIIGVSVPVLTANIESATARYGSLQGRGGQGAVRHAGARTDARALRERDAHRRGRAKPRSCQGSAGHVHGRLARGVRGPSSILGRNDSAASGPRTPAGKNMVVRDVEGLEFELVEPMNRRMTW